MSKRIKYPDWTLIDWDGNPQLKLKCWRKSFGKNHVSVGVGDFLTVVFSFGPDSDHSHSSTRWNYDLPVISEQEAMARIDAQGALRKSQPGCWRFTLTGHTKPDGWK